MKKYIYGHTSFETAYEVDNYPWGFRLKTKVRYWIETNDKSNGGQRFVKCTMNPKTGAWCKPKKSTYAILANLYLDENEHVQWDNLSIYHSNDDDLTKYIDLHKDHLGEYEIKQLKLLKSRNEVMKHVTVTCECVPLNVSEEERKARKEEQERTKQRVLNAIMNRTKTIEI